jgi:hypothetical protein
MSRNLYILGGTLFVFAVICFGMMFTTGPYQIGLPGNGSLWMTNMFEQVERRAAERERLKGKRRG